jgi:hypothetical protein
MKNFKYWFVSVSLLSTLSLAHIHSEDIADRSGYGYNQDNYRGSIQYQNYGNYGDQYRGDQYRYDNNAVNYGGYYGGAPYYNGSYYNTGTPVVPGYGYPGYSNYGGTIYSPFPDSARSDAIYRANQQLPR